MIFGYLDPGTSGLILQAVLGGVAGIALFFRSRFARLRRKSKKPDQRATGSSPADASAVQDQASET